jgi:hypothetical protein
MCFDFGDPDGYEDAGSEVLAIGRGLLAVVDGAGGGVRLVLSCERTGAITESIEGISETSVPAFREPCGIRVSLGASQEG